ncbi:MAG: lipid A biosynthesis lauroyl acyltransferase [Betaproteobacteria bacterium RBG_16_58_11]|nr:MAG: lipid A biosynthesis lauroyl acyltransferase [Betaproteobacteria bacterium RBG_16_58_11]OFZ96423.1 MAG: lipid A biosynthesis lauroyl acyltransferase [Betaproteobacteria bacterium RBG_19FT_COMBO_58_11]
MSINLLRLFARLPLGLVHALGAVAGWGVYLASPRYARRLRENLYLSKVTPDSAAKRRLLFKAISEAGKGALEIFVVWFRPYPAVLKLVRSVEGWEHVQTARAAGKGVMLLTPHVGCFEIGGMYCGAQFPFTELYRPPKLLLLEPLMRAGRARGQVSLATTDYAGVKKLLAALKQGQAIGALPDQAPSLGEGVWADFFGRPAYTMTLIARLQQKTGATIIFFYAERLSWGRGFVIRYLPPIAPLSEDPEQAARQINAAVEAIVRACPAQYLWSYNRYKAVRGEGA